MDVEGTVSAVGLHPGKDGKMPSIKVTFATSLGDIVRYLSTSEGALANTAKDLTTLGWPPVPNMWAIDDMLATRCLIGKRVQLVVEQGEFNGKTKWEIKWINELGGRSQAAPVDARSLSTMLRQKMGMKEPARKTEDVPF